MSNAPALTEAEADCGIDVDIVGTPDPGLMAMIQRLAAALRLASAERGTLAQAVAILGVKSRKLQAMAQRGEIPGAAKLGRQWTFDLAKLRRFVEQQEQEAACRGSAKPRPDATGATGFSTASFKSGGDKSGGRLGQMIRQLQKRVDRQSKSGH
jgi:Helix-turn-helix domain